MNILFGRSRPTNAPQPEIRPAFAQSVLDLEIDFNFSPSLESLQSLTNIYTEAIEFYESHKNPKFQYYKTKLQTLLSRPDVLSLLTPPKPPPSIQKKVPSLIFNRSLEKTLQDHQTESSSLSKRIKYNVKTQSDTLAERLEKRKRTRNSNIKGKGIEARLVDKSAGLNHVEVFESEVEEIMERYAESKALVKKQVEDAYSEYLIELGQNKGGILKEVVNQMEKAMAEEIMNKLKELDDRRAEEIALARKKLMSLC